MVIALPSPDHKHFKMKLHCFPWFYSFKISAWQPVNFQGMFGNKLTSAGVLLNRTQGSHSQRQLHCWCLRQHPTPPIRFIPEGCLEMWACVLLHALRNIVMSCLITWIYVIYTHWVGQCSFPWQRFKSVVVLDLTEFLGYNCYTVQLSQNSWWQRCSERSLLFDSCI